MDLINFLPALVSITMPLLASGLIALLGSTLGERSAKIGIWALAISAGAAIVSLYQAIMFEPIQLSLPILPAPFSPTLLMDRLTAVMMVLITGVSLVIHAYSRRYMHDDPGYVRFFSLLSLLTFVLLSLVTCGNLLWLLVCWHLITWILASLLAFNQDSQAARAASRRTLWVQGIGDAAFAGALAVLYLTYGTLDLRELFDQLQGGPVRLALGSAIEAPTLTTLLLLVSIMTKSAQFPFHIWLPGTIEAPTPVSALLHAGIVNAGGFLVNRMAPLFGEASLTLHLMFVVGAVTALIGAAAMLTQSSIKRTLVYSTMGQMGYMVMECGLGAFALAVFHLCAHGLFKATLFLNSGAQIHKARAEFTLPHTEPAQEAVSFSFMTWVTGVAMTLVLPLVILLMDHGIVNIPLFEAQGTVIFLFFAWMTSAQAIFSLYLLQAVASWRISLIMLSTLAFIGLTYLWAGEAFTHFLYPTAGQAAGYFQAASWPQGLFEAFVGLSTLFVVTAWVVLYSKAHGIQVFLPAWVGTIQTRLYVACMNALYVDQLLQALTPGTTRARRRPSPSSPR